MTSSGSLFTVFWKIARQLPPPGENKQFFGNVLRFLGAVGFVDQIA